jgi:pyrimidine operon attenuation protein/uracil phosphoribosyltransferase
MERPAGKRTCLYTSEQLAVVMEELAGRVAGLVAGRSRLAIIGILRRGAPLAERLAGALAERLPGVTPLRLDLAIKRYADNLTLLYPETRLTEQAQHAGLDLTGYTLVVVDDVLYTGHSLLRAVAYLAGKGAAEIRAVTLVDRGIAQLPIHAAVVGVRLDVAPPDIIECNVPPYEPEFKIELLQLERVPER